MMLLAKVITASVIGQTVAQLVPFSKLGSKGAFLDSRQHVNDQQKPLLKAGGPADTDFPPFKAGTVTRKSQDNSSLCATYGESQWTGTIDVSDDHRLFYWYFDSRSDPKNDPIIIWLNGGPGGSSMMGLFNEMGPCWLEPGAINEPIPNEYAWNSNASLLFIDQPAGVGFSSLKDKSLFPKADLEGAQDFQMFLNIFFDAAFPEKAHLPIHIAGESYGGHYVPTYVNHILSSRAYDSKFAFWGNITSLILVNALIDFSGLSIGAYELLCSGFRGGGIVNETACENMKVHLPECERLGRSCDLSNDGHECWAMIEYFHLGCDDYPLCKDPRKGNFTAYLNQPHVKAALGFPNSFTFEPINSDINSAYPEGRTSYKPTTRELGAILDAHRKPGLGDIGVLVLNGNEDYIVNTPGQAWLYDNRLGWSGQAEYRIQKWRAIEGMGEGVTGFWKGTRDGRLVFFGVDGAGHTVPGDVREGSLEILRSWLWKTYE